MSQSLMVTASCHEASSTGKSSRTGSVVEWAALAAGVMNGPAA